MSEYEFTPRYRLGNPTENAEIYLESLANSGCEDAIVGVGQKSKSALDAITSAISAAPISQPSACTVSCFASKVPMPPRRLVSRRFLPRNRYFFLHHVASSNIYVPPSRCPRAVQVTLPAPYIVRTNKHYLKNLHSSNSRVHTAN